MLEDMLESALTSTTPNKAFPETSTVDSGRSRLHPERFFGAITTGCMRPFVPRTNENEITTRLHPDAPPEISSQMSGTTKEMAAEGGNVIFLIIKMVVVVLVSSCRRQQEKRCPLHTPVTQIYLHVNIVRLYYKG